MAKGDTLRLLVDSYEQPQAGDKPSERKLRELTKGETFEALSDAEYDRLVEIGAAIDPKVANAEAKAEAEATIARLKAEQDALQEQIDSAEAESNLSSATKPELQKYLEAEGLDTEGTKPELLERAQAHQAAQE